MHELMELLKKEYRRIYPNEVYINYAYWDNFDKLIREWLEGKALKLDRLECDTKEVFSNIRNILGLVRPKSLEEKFEEYWRAAIKSHEGTLRSHLKQLAQIAEEYHETQTYTG